MIKQFKVQKENALSDCRFLEVGPQFGTSTINAFMPNWGPTSKVKPMSNTRTAAQKLTDLVIFVGLLQRQADIVPAKISDATSEILQLINLFTHSHFQ